MFGKKGDQAGSSLKILIVELLPMTVRGLSLEAHLRLIVTPRTLHVSDTKHTSTTVDY